MQTSVKNASTEPQIVSMQEDTDYVAQHICLTESDNFGSVTCSVAVKCIISLSSEGLVFSCHVRWFPLTYSFNWINELTGICYSGFQCVSKSCPHPLLVEFLKQADFLFACLKNISFWWRWECSCSRSVFYLLVWWTHALSSGVKEQCCLLSGKSQKCRLHLGLEKQKQCDFKGRRGHFEMELQDKKFDKLK